MAKSITIKQMDIRIDCIVFRLENQIGVRSEVIVPVSSIDYLREWTRARLDETEEILLCLALAVYFARDPSASNPNLIVNKLITLDLQGKFNYPDSVLRVG